jgi:hypothetical protein
MGKNIITEGSITREQSSLWFPFLAARYRGRRKAIKDFTHTAPDFVFWIFPNGELFDAKDAHRENYPRGYEYILDDEPDYGGFLRGRLATNYQGQQLLVVYCRPESLVASLAHLTQLLDGLSQLPVPLHDNALVISDNGDIFGSLEDIKERERSLLSSTNAPTS